MNSSLSLISSFNVNDYFTALMGLYSGSCTISEIYEILKSCLNRIDIDYSTYDYLQFAAHVNPIINKECPIKVISFDLDNTLWDSTKLLENAREKSFNFFCSKCPSCLDNYPSYKEFEMHINGVMKTNEKYKNEWSFLRLMCFKEELQKSNKYTEDEINRISEDSMKIFYKHRNSVSKYFYNGVLELLNVLKECKFTLITITNGNCDISQINDLKSIFKYNINGESIHHFKPDKEIFNYAIDLCRKDISNNNNSNSFVLNNNECIHVGDSLDEDIVGAKSVGIHTILLNMKDDDDDCKNSRNYNEYNQPDVEVKSFYEILVGILFIILESN